MRQVPHYLFIGNGRVSRHFQHYFTFLSIRFSVWHRSLSLLLLNQYLKRCTHILILINDDAIDDFILKYLQESSAYRIHFSGSLVSNLAIGAHPFMTFNNHLYDHQLYTSIHFIIDNNAPNFANILPNIPNPHYRLETALKDKYHALCVLSGNFSTLLWQKLLDSLENEFNIPHAAAHAFLRQQTQNIIDHHPSALTGPLVRNDKNTIKNNLAALNGDLYQSVYENFVSCFNQTEKI